MDASKRFVLIVGSDTDKVTTGACQFYASYNSWKKYVLKVRLCTIGAISSTNVTKL